MSLKFGRNYRLTIQSGGDSPTDIVIAYPLTLEFNIVRGIGASLNTLQCNIFNLSEVTRSKIFQDRFGYFSAGNGEGAYRRVTLEAGYGDNLTIVFQGNLFEAGSSRRGTEIVTTIDARDGAFDTATTKTFKTYQSPISLQDLIKQLIGEFPNVKVGQVGSMPDTLKRPVAVDGNTWEAIQLYSNENAFIDNETVNVLGDAEVIQNSIQTIDADTGLLETPHRDEAYLTISTLFEPNILMGQFLTLKSTIQPLYNGSYKVASVQHSGIISAAQNGEYRSTFGLLLSGKLFGAFQTVNTNIQRVNLSSPQAN